MKTFIRTLLGVLAALLCTTGHAQDLHVLDLSKFSMETAKIVNFNEPYFGYADPKGATTEHWDQYTAVDFDLDLLRYQDLGLYFNNTVDAASTNHQYRMVSWEWEGGLQLSSAIQAFWHHHSTHVMDSARDEHFPLVNYVGARVVFYDRRNK